MPLIAIYIFKIMLCSGILFGYYWLALRNKIFHQYNRFYLLASVVLSLILPFVKINIWHNANAAQTGSIQLLKVVSGGNEYLDDIVLSANRNPFTTVQLLQLFYCVISVIFLFIFIRGLVKIYILYKNHEHTIVEKIQLIHCSDQSTPFSFLKYIFWNTHIDINSSTGRQIFKHELSHVQQKHTHDKLFINIILVFLWCNPFYWLIRKELNLIHEFIADKAAVEDNDTAAFAHMILQAAYPRQQFHLTNPFFYSPIKRRLSMLTKNNKSKVGYIGRVLVLPLLLLIFAAFSFKTKTIHQNLNSTIGKQLTIVINAGHGGKDLGAVASSGELEKNITMAIAKKIQQLNQNKQFEILLIRGTDEYLSPQQIVDMATKAGADLFISLHVDALPEKNTKTGMTFWIPNNDFPKFDASKLLGEALLAQFKNNYGLYVYDNLNQREKKAWVLNENKCPSILIETGFMSNDKDVAFLTNESNQEEIARNILIGIEKYAGAINRQVLQSEQKQQKEVEVKRKDSPSDTTTRVNEITIGPEKPMPLYILDGKEEDYTTLQKVTPADIDRVDVLKGEAAIKLYGDKAKNGVVIFTTKKVTDPVSEITTPAETPINTSDERVFTKVENEPEFTGGKDEWIKYLTSNIDGNIPLKDGWKAGKYTVIVEFIVDKEGNISEVKTTNYQGTKTSAHCINLIQKGPKWKPALQNGHLVKAYKKQPITFVVQ